MYERNCTYHANLFNTTDYNNPVSSMNCIKMKFFLSKVLLQKATENLLLDHPAYWIRQIDHAFHCTRIFLFYSEIVIPNAILSFYSTSSNSVVKNGYSCRTGEIFCSLCCHRRSLRSFYVDTSQVRKFQVACEQAILNETFNTEMLSWWTCSHVYIYSYLT